MKAASPFVRPDAHHGDGVPDAFVAEERVWTPLARNIRPDAVVLTCGADALEGDPLSRMLSCDLVEEEDFDEGKLKVEGLGEFCCSSRPLRLESPAIPTEDRHA